MTDKQRISALETLRDSLLAKVMELEEINQRQARIIADMRAAEMKRNPHLKSVENGAGNSAVYQRDEDVLTDEQARVLERLALGRIQYGNVEALDMRWLGGTSILSNLTKLKYIHVDFNDWDITNKGRAALAKYNAAQQTKNTI
jgi:hypothetical protein